MNKILFESLEDFVNESKKKPTTSEGKEKKFKKVMREFGKGKLVPFHSDKSLKPKSEGGDEKDRKQSLAIAFSEAGMSKKKKSKKKQTVKESLDEWAMGNSVYNNHEDSNEIFTLEEVVHWLNDEFAVCEDDEECKSECIINFIDKIGITLEDFAKQLNEYKDEVDQFSQKLIDEINDLIENDLETNDFNDENDISSEDYNPN